MLKILKPLICYLLLAAPVHAADASGVWLRDSGASRIRIAPCGDALCGSIVWLKEPRADSNNPDPVKAKEPLLGRRIFFSMKPAGENQWAGQAYNPEDGKTYSGKMSLSGATLTTSGCVLGGLICKSVSWSKVE